ncbi:MAG: hypothetical protein P8N15_05365, partial [Flavobacteriaceae bacterium]|nr:hypothetical protein [Flavobacteriaceae bacterium]
MINENKLRSNKMLFFVIIILTVLLFSTLILRANFNLQLEKSKGLELLNQNLNLDIEKKNRELTSKVNFISQRS